jgi:hypothetical protein
VLTSNISPSGSLTVLPFPGVGRTVIIFFMFMSLFVNSYVQGTILANTFSVPDYCTALESGKLPVASKKEFTLLERMRYDFLMKLFGTRLDRGQLRRKYGRLFERALWKEITLFRLLGALRFNGDQMVLTASGMYFWVIMMREFFIGVNNFRDISRSKINEGKQ